MKKLKYIKRKNIWSNYCGNNTFDPVECVARSYGWWIYVKRIADKVVFNSYRYSVTTIKHQYQMRQLLKELGIKIDLEVECPQGLQTLGLDTVCQIEDEIRRVKEAISKGLNGSFAQNNRISRLNDLKNMMSKVKELLAYELHMRGE